MMLERKRSGPIRGCVVPVIGLIGFIVLCFVFCEVVFLLGNPSARATTGGALLPFFF